MGEAILCGQSGGGGIKINGILERYGVYTGETIKAGDFVDIVNVQTGTNEYTSTLFLIQLILDDSYLLRFFLIIEYLWHIVELLTINYMVH